MSYNQFAIDCLQDCTEQILPVADDQNCVKVPKLSEINGIYMKGTDDGPMDMSLAADWAGKVDNADTTGEKMKFLKVVGSIPEPEVKKFPGPDGVEIITEKIYTLTAKNYTLSSDAMYDFFRKLECQTLKPNIYYTTRGDRMFGKKNAVDVPDNGIKIIDIDVKMPLDEGADSYEKAIIVIRFSALVSPDRVTNPLA